MLLSLNDGEQTGDARLNTEKDQRTSGFESKVRLHQVLVTFY